MKPTDIFEPPHWKKRQPVLTSTKNFKMARSAHAYVRGSTLKFYEWLDSLSPRSLPEGMSVWICGDCHIGNLGPIASAAGLVEIQIRDFDQTVIGNSAHDLIRLGLSLAMAVRGSDLPGVTTTRILEQLIDGYTLEFATLRKVPPSERPDVVYQALKSAQKRSWRHLSKERVAGKTASLPLGKRFWPISRQERIAINQIFDTGDLNSLATQLGHRPDDAKVKLTDAAYWLKGCSSLGLLRYAVLLDIEGRAASGRDLCLIDIKEATKAMAPRSPQADMPRDNAERVLMGAKSMSPHLGERMASGRLLDRPVFMRELLPEDLKIELDRVSCEEATKAARYFARVVGRAHARQMDPQNRKAWRAELARNRSKTLDAPSWLWSSIVELIATHERGYLDHCRRYALGEGP